MSQHFDNSYFGK